MFVIDTIAHRLKRGCETMAYPKGPAPALPDRHGGALKVDASKCADGCNACVPVCPTEAIARPGRPTRGARSRSLYLLRRLCGSLSARKPSRKPATTAWPCVGAKTSWSAIRERNRSVWPPLSTRNYASCSVVRCVCAQVSAGGCGACEADTNVLGTIGWDLGRFGIQFVASPRHADGLLITGCVSKNMELALKKTWDAVPEPKIAIAVGACAIAGGPFVGNPQILNGAASVVPVDLHSRLSTASVDDPRRLAAIAGSARTEIRNPGKFQGSRPACTMTEIGTDCSYCL